MTTDSHHDRVAGRRDRTPSPAGDAPARPTAEPARTTVDQPRAHAAPPAGTEERDSQHRALLDLVAHVVAPASLLTGLGVYFGFLHTHAFYRYLNIDASILEFSTTDYLIRSVNGFLGPAAVLALSGLLLGLVYVGLRAALLRLRGRIGHLWVVPVALFTIGAVLVANAVVELAWGRGLILSSYLAMPASLGVGVFLAVSGIRLTEAIIAGRDEVVRPRLALATSAALLLGIGAMWATAQYADHAGRQEARFLAAHLDRRPAVVIHSPERLGVSLQEEVITSRTGSASYRYSGGRLVLQSGGKYLLLSEGWTPDEGRTILVPDEPGTRLEFAAHQPLE